jgi:hypothetical protein
MLPFVRASGALAFRRSTTALTSRLAPTGSAPGHASWDAGRAGVMYIPYTPLYTFALKHAIGFLALLVSWRKKVKITFGRD